MIARMVKKRVKASVTNEKIMGFLVEMDERMTNMDERIIDTKNYLKDEVATKSELNIVKQDVKEVKGVMQPLSKAVDKDAKTLMQHDKRIPAIEHRLEITAK